MYFLQSARSAMVETASCCCCVGHLFVVGTMMPPALYGRWGSRDFLIGRDGEDSPVPTIFVFLVTLGLVKEKGSYIGRRLWRRRRGNRIVIWPFMHVPLPHRTWTRVGNTFSSTAPRLFSSAEESMVVGLSPGLLRGRRIDAECCPNPAKQRMPGRALR